MAKQSGGGRMMEIKLIVPETNVGGIIADLDGRCGADARQSAAQRERDSRQRIGATAHAAHKG